MAAYRPGPREDHCVACRPLTHEEAGGVSVSEGCYLCEACGEQFMWALVERTLWHTREQSE